MKDIKEYIIKSFNESLFDKEDDLLDKTPNQSMIDWFKDPINARGLWDNDNRKLANDFFINPEGKVDIKRTFRDSLGRSLRLFNPIPKWIKLEEEPWNKVIIINIEYPIKSQKDIPGAGLISFIENNKDIKNININVSGKMDEQSILKLKGINSIRNLNLKFIDHSAVIRFISIINSNVNFYDLSNIQSEGKKLFRIIFTDEKGPVIKYLKNVYKEMKDHGLNRYIISDHIKEFSQMVDNGIDGFYLNSKGLLQLVTRGGDPILLFWATNNAESYIVRSMKDYA